MADIFVSYTSSDQKWAEWIGLELEKLGHVAHVHEWEISAGGDISQWMEVRHQRADHVLSVVSEAYLKAPYSSWERRAAQWAAATSRPNFVLPVFVEPCQPPTLLATIKRCDLYGLDEDQARVQLIEYLKPAVKPAGPVPFPGSKKAVATDGAAQRPASVAFPGKSEAALKEIIGTITNIPINVPRHFLGRDDDLAQIDAALNSGGGRAAITVLHGLRGVGKTILAAAYAKRHSGDYRATWWIRAETESTMRADIVGLGVKLGWVAPDEAEDPALAVVLEKLRHEGQDVLLIYDNAVGPNEVSKWLPDDGGPRAIVTSNAPNWRALATPVSIATWSNEVGADFLIARAGRKKERDAALVLSEALGGLPLAHEQAAAYCERLGISLSSYADKFAATPGKYLDDASAAPDQYHDGSTVSKTYGLAIDEAAKLHPAASLLIAYAGLLAPEPVPLFLFTEGREFFGEPLTSVLPQDDLDEAVVALRTFALVDRDEIPDERNSTTTTDCIRLHRLVRRVVQALCGGEVKREIRTTLLKVLAEVFPFSNKGSYAVSRARRLDAIAAVAIEESAELGASVEASVEELLFRLALYREFIGNYSEARLYYERALRISERIYGEDDVHTARNLNNIVKVMRSQNDVADARVYQERAVAIMERIFGRNDLITASCLNNLGALLREQKNFSEARDAFDRALSIRESVLGSDDPETASTINSIGVLLWEKGDFDEAESFLQRALSIDEKALGPNHERVADTLNNVSFLFERKGDLETAKVCCERALAIRGRVLGWGHPDTALSLHQLGHLLYAQHNLVDARSKFMRALETFEKKLGADHPYTKSCAKKYAVTLDELGHREEAATIRARYSIA